MGDGANSLRRQMLATAWPRTMNKKKPVGRKSYVPKPPTEPSAADAIRDAASDGLLATVKQMLTDCPSLAYAQDTYGGATPLHHAAKWGKLAVMRYLLKQGVNADIQDCRGGTPLHTPHLFDEAKVVRLLLGYGAKVNARTQWGTTTLHHISTAAGARLLLRAGARVNSRTGGWTPLHAAAAGGRTDVVRVLLGAGARVNAKTEGNITPLHRACRHPEIITLLLEHGARKDIKDYLGMTPVDWASADDSLDGTKRAALLALGGPTIRPRRK